MTASNNNRDNQLIDDRQRQISYLRVSLTNQCNFRCLYCYGLPHMAPEPDSPLPHDCLFRLLHAFARLGVQKIRFTGGEPLTHPNIVGVVKEAAAIENISQVAITTNGLTLARLLPALIEAGLTGLNVSLDSLKRDKFREITGVDGFDRVRAGIDAAIDSGAFDPVKINTVVIRDINDDEINDFVRWATNRPVDIRFIEFMPTDRSGWGKDRLVPEKEIIERIGIPLIPLPIADANAGPARSFAINNGVGRISFISAVSRSFCRECNRLRLTADGSVVGCLFGKSKVNLNEILSRHESEEKIDAAIQAMLTAPGFRRKPSAYSITSEQPSMRKIGG